MQQKKKPVHSNLIAHLYFTLIFPNLPLMWRCKLAVAHMKWKEYKRNFKDDFLGPLSAVVIHVDQDWEWKQGKHSSTRVRDITYRLKRAKLPFCYPRIYKGTQCKDETALPLARVNHSVVISINDQVAVLNKQIAADNEKHLIQKQLRESIVNHQFKEYDHDHPNHH